MIKKYVKYALQGGNKNLPAGHWKHKNSSEKKTTQLKFKQVSMILARCLKTDTKFPVKLTNVLDKGLFSMKFDDDDVDNRIEEWYMEIYGAKMLKVQALGKYPWKSSVHVLDSTTEGKK